MPNLSNALRKDNLHFKGQTGPETSAHKVDLATFSLDGGLYRPWVTKLNKHEGRKGVDASVLEVAFSEIASLFMRPGLTPPAKLVLDNMDNVIGVASENYNVQLKKLIDKDEKCYDFDPNHWTYKPISTEMPAIPDLSELNSLRERYPGETFSAADIRERMGLKKASAGVNFLNKVPPNFFPTLMGKYKEKEVDIDMESLASILTGSYALEEDDLHKGNIGFYVTDIEDRANPGQSKKKFTFFKIDHDLMFTDSIMSRKNMRWYAELFYNKDSFKITVRDLEGFPDLQDSGNHYWPTRKRSMVKSAKAYTTPGEREAFADLKINPDFRDAKWNCFLKYSLMPTALVEKSLTMHLDPKDDADKISMVRNSVGTRIVQLKQILSESPEFLKYLQMLPGQEIKEKIKSDIALYMKNSGIDEKEQDKIMRQIDNTYSNFVKYAQANNVSQLGKAIMLDCYQFSYTGKPIKEEIDSAQTKFVEYKEKRDYENAFKYACIIVDLVGKSDPRQIDKTEYLITVERFKKDYLKPESIKSLDDFKSVADKIRSSDLPLKQQKNELLAVLKESHLSVNDLKELKKELKKSEPDDPSLKFINQLRSELWIVRIIFGTYGNTTTSTMMIKEIDSQIKELNLLNKNKCFKERIHDHKNEGTPVDDELPLVTLNLPKSTPR